VPLDEASVLRLLEAAYAGQKPAIGVKAGV
jgi:hypothetical protein